MWTVEEGVSGLHGDKWPIRSFSLEIVERTRITFTNPNFKNEEALLFPDFVSNQSQIPNTDHKVREMPPLSSFPSIIIFLKVNAVLS